MPVIYLHKLIPLLLSPLFLVLIALFLVKVWRSRILSISGVLLLLVASNPLVANRATAYLEKDYPPRDLETLPKADVTVVLSGMVNVISNGQKGYKYEYGGSVDRLFAGIDIIKAQKADEIVFTEGEMPWSVGVPEGDILKQRAVSMGIPPKIIRLSPEVENTEDEARAVSEMLEKDERSIILITSAFHMPRAKRLFESEGLKVTPFPVDFHATARKFTLMDVVPSAAALADTSDFFREMLGRFYYAIKYSAA